MNTTTIRYSTCPEIIDKASNSEMQWLNNALRPTTGTPHDLMEYLKTGGAFCNAFLSANEHGLATRNNESFIESWIVAADIDNAVIDKKTGHKRRKTAGEGYYSLDDAMRDENVAGRAAFLYTTPSHSDDWHRFRIIWVLPEPIRDQTEYKRLVRAFIEQFDSDRQTSAASQIFYGSRNGSFQWFGNTLDRYQLRIYAERSEQVHTEQREFVVKATRDLTERDVREMLQVIPPHQDYIDWIKIISAVTAIVGPQAAEKIIEEWSPGYDGEVRYKIARRLEKVGAGTLIYYAKRNGWTAPPGMYSDKAKANSPDVIRRFLESFYDWRKNVVTDGVEFSPKGSEEYEPLDDYALNSLLLDMRSSGINIAKERLYETLDSSFSERFHPFREYFDNLPQWDGQDRLQDLIDCLRPDLTAYESQEDFDSFARLVLGTWLRGVVYAATNHKANHIMPILQGGQGIGKTRFLLSLCPNELRQYLYVGPIRDDKDFKIMMSRTIIGIDDELESMNRREMNAIKSLITQEAAQERGAYKRTHQNYERKISFIGSVNRREFLNDETGSRRFPVLAVEGIDMEARAGIDTEMIYAQARAELKAGARHYFNGEDVRIVERVNEEFATDNDADQLLKMYFRPVERDYVGSGLVRLTTTEAAIEILKSLSIGTSGDVKAALSSNFVYQLGRSLRKLNYQHSKVNGLKKWYLVRITKTEGGVW